MASIRRLGCLGSLLVYPVWFIVTALAGLFLLWPLKLGEPMVTHNGFGWIVDGPIWRWPIMFAWWTILYMGLGRRKRSS